MTVEAKILHQILTSGDLGAFTDAGLTPRLFSTLRPELEYIFEWAGKHSKPPSLERFKDKFDVPLIPSNDSPSELMADLSHAYAEYATRQAVRQAATSQLSGHDRLNELRAAIADISETVQPSKDTELCGEDFPDALREQLEKRRSSGGITGIETPWPSYNRETGGIQRDELIIVAARTGVGKSFLLLKLAFEAWRQGETVLFISNELSTEVIQMRFAAIALGVSYGSMRRGDVDIDDVCERASRLQSASRFIVVANDADMTVGGVPFVAAKIKKYKPTIVFVDGAYLLDDTRGGKDVYQRAGNVVSDLKVLNKATMVPIVASWQLNRQAADKGAEISTKHLGLSDRVGADSSYIWALFQTDDDMHDKVMRIYFPKRRESAVEALSIQWDFDGGMKMDEITIPTYSDEAPTYDDGQPVEYGDDEDSALTPTPEVTTLHEHPNGDASAFDLGPLGDMEL